MVEAATERKLHTTIFTHEMLKEVETRFGREPRVTTVVLGETLTSLSKNGLRISDPYLIIPQGEIRQLYPPIRTEVLYLDGLLDEVPYFDKIEGDKIYSFWDWTLVGEREEERDVQSIIEGFPKIPGVNIGVPLAEVVLPMYKDAQVREILQNHRIWTANLYQNTENDLYSRVVFKDWLRHVVIDFNQDGISLSCLPVQEDPPEKAGIFVVGFPEDLDLSRYKLTSVSSQG